MPSTLAVMLVVLWHRCACQRHRRGSSVCTFFEELQAEGLSELFLKFPTYIIPVHEPADGVHLSKEEQIMLLFVHCLPGCDTTNFFFGVGKASFLNTAMSPIFASKWCLWRSGSRMQKGSFQLTRLEMFTTYQNSWSLKSMVKRPDSIHWPV